jgi:hypothetical protein
MKLPFDSQAVKSTRVPGSIPLAEHSNNLQSLKFLSILQEAPMIIFSALLWGNAIFNLFHRPLLLSMPAPSHLQNRLRERISR